MSWFTKKKDDKDKKKESSVLAIETMHEDMEHISKGPESKDSKEVVDKKPLKKSPFLSEKDLEQNNDNKEGVVDDKKVEEKEKEKTFPHPASAVAVETQIEIVDKNAMSDIKQAKVGKEVGTKTEKTIPGNEKEIVPPTSAAPIERKKETEEDKMEKVVKAANPTASKATKPTLKPKPPIEKVEELTKSQEKPLVKKAEKLTEKKKGLSIFSELKEGGSATTSPTKQSSDSVSKSSAAKSPFGVPAQGIKVKNKVKVKKKTTSQQKFNRPLLILAIAVFILSLAAGGYSYYRKSIQPPPIEISTPPIIAEKKPVTPEYLSDNFADSAVVLQTSQTTLISDLKEYIKKEKEINPNKFIGGQFVRPLQNKTEYITGEEVLKIFGSHDATINGFLDKPVAIFITEEQVEVLKQQEVVENALPTTTPAAPEKIIKNAVKLSLVLEIKKESNPGDVVERLTEVETILPGTLKNLMIEEDITIPSDKIIFNQAIPQKEGLVHVVRYFNFQVDDITKSIEWGSLLYKSNSYIFFTTSKSSTESLIKALY